MNEYRVRKTIKRLKETQKIQKADIAYQKSIIKKILNIPLDVRDFIDEYRLKELKLRCDIYKTNVGYMNTAITALRKQIPMSKWVLGHGFYKCSSCGYIVRLIDDYCPSCGQKFEDFCKTLKRKEGQKE